jgi:hypothetical protein
VQEEEEVKEDKVRAEQEVQEEVELELEADESAERMEERVRFALYALARLTGQAVPGDKEGEMNASPRGNS